MGGGERWEVTSSATFPVTISESFFNPWLTNNRLRYYYFVVVVENGKTVSGFYYESFLRFDNTLY